MENIKIKFDRFGNYGNVDWIKSAQLINYQNSFEWMLSYVKKIQIENAKEVIWLLEHEDIYTAGTSAKENDFKGLNNIKVLKTNRGGQWTWHGPGQRIVYFMMNLNNRKTDVRWYVNKLEQLLINTLREFSITAERRETFPGVWVKRTISSQERIDKIGAIGIRISRWIAYHGISININPDLSKYDGIIPCGVTQGGVTSIADLGIKSSMDDFDQVLAHNFENLFHNHI